MERLPATGMVMGESVIIWGAASVLGGLLSITVQNAPVATSMASPRLRMVRGVQAVRAMVIMVASLEGGGPCVMAAPSKDN